MLARVALLAPLLVAVLAVVHQATHGWDGRRRHLNQVKTALARHLQRLAGGQDAELLPVLVDDPHLADADALVDAGGTVGGRWWAVDGQVLLSE